MSVELKPRRLYGGPWTAGYALHIHTLSSTFIGNDERGRPRFDTKRSPVGELLYQLKYRNNQASVDELAVAAETF